MQERCRKQTRTLERFVAERGAHESATPQVAVDTTGSGR